MQKILDLLTKAGCKPELVASIGEALEEYKTTVNEQYEADYAAKVESAKRVCIEETEAHKRDLARRVQIFLETKEAAINAHVARQSALSESEAMTKLKNVKALVEGVELNGQADNGQATAAIENAKRKIQQLTEERDQAIATANRQNAIAEKVIQRNRLLVTENAKLRSNTGDGGVRQTVAEGRGAPRGNGGRVDGTRRAAQPATTRPTIVENQTRRPAAPASNGNVRTEGNRGGFGVNDIASTMDEDLV